jgi:acyl-CoA thioester hydrolase
MERNMAAGECEIEFRVRYPEVDQMGVVHHSRYAIYFEMGRTELLRVCGVSYREMEEAGVFFVVAKLETRFLAPAKYDDILTLHTKTTRLTRARIEHEYKLYRKSDKKLLTEGHTVLASVDKAGQVTIIPDAFMENFQPVSNEKTPNV